MTLDATTIFIFSDGGVRASLCQGGEPPDGPEVRDAGFEVLVLCAEEIQDGHYDGVLVVRCPLDDDEDTRPINEIERLRALSTSAAAARYLRAGADVLVTCAQGRNRSGLVTAMTLHWLTGMPGSWCIEQVRRARPDSLTNDSFVKVLEGMR